MERDTRFSGLLSRRCFLMLPSTFVCGSRNASGKSGDQPFGCAPQSVLQTWIDETLLGRTRVPLGQVARRVAIDRQVSVKFSGCRTVLDFSGCDIYVCASGDGRLLREGDAAFVFEGARLEIRGLEVRCEFRSPRITGIQCSADDSMVVDCRAENFGWVGVGVLPGKGSAGDDVRVVRTVSLGSRFGFYSGARGTKFEFCYASHFWSRLSEFPDGVWRPESEYYDGFVLSRGSGALLKSCVAVDCGQSGVYVGEFSGVSVIGGDFSDNWNKGVDIGPGTPRLANGIIVDGVRCVDNRTGNVHLYNAIDALVQNCYVRDRFATFALSVNGQSRRVHWRGNDFGSSGKVVYIGPAVLDSGPLA